MKKISTIIWTIIITSFIFISCGSPSIDNGSWSGKDVIAGVGFSYSLETKSNNTYSLIGVAGGLSVNESGTFRKINDNEIMLTSGEFNGTRFKKDGSTLRWYLENGMYFMSLN